MFERSKARSEQLFDTRGQGLPWSHLLDHTGHLSMWERAGEILRDLAAH